MERVILSLDAGDSRAAMMHSPLGVAAVVAEGPNTAAATRWETRSSARNIGQTRLSHDQHDYRSGDKRVSLMS